MCQNHNICARPRPALHPSRSAAVRAGRVPLPPSLPPAAVPAGLGLWGPGRAVRGPRGPGPRSPRRAPPAAPWPSAWRAQRPPAAAARQRAARGGRAHWLCRRHVTGGAGRGVRRWLPRSRAVACVCSAPWVSPLCVPSVFPLCSLCIPSVHLPCPCSVRCVRFVSPLCPRSFLYCSVPFMSPLHPLSVPSLSPSCPQAESRSCRLAVSLLCPRSVLAWQNERTQSYGAPRKISFGCLEEVFY